MRKKIMIISLTSLILIIFLIIGLRDSGVLNGNTFNESILEPNDLIEGSYQEFLSTKAADKPNQIFLVDLDNFTYEEGLFEDDLPYIDTFKDDNNVVKEGTYLPETGNVTFKVNVDKEGLYQLNVTYFNIKGRGASIVREILINDELQYKEASSITFLRFWQDEFLVEEKRVKGINDIRPSQAEKHLWSNQDVKDLLGFDNESYYFYFKDGLNTITLVGNREPIVINEIKLFQKEIDKPYDEYLRYYENLGFNKNDTDFNEVVQGENAFLKSSPSFYPIAEYSSYKFTPFERQLTRYNAIGGVNFRIPGEKIIWEINVPEAGLYLITFKVLQNFSRGEKVSRKLEINGKIPFKEANDIGFNYSGDLQNITIRKDEDLYFYFEQGINTISLATTVGIYSNAITQINADIVELRKLYREIVMRIGLNPDPMQDYLLNRNIENLDQRLEDLIDNFSDVKKEITHISAGKTGLVGIFDRLIYQLGKFRKDEKNIQVGLRELEQNISNLSAWVINITEQPLTIDEIIVHGSKHKLKRVSTNFFEKLWHEITMFIVSFKDLGDFGSTLEVDGPTIEVWIGQGRDQTTILRQLIDESFVTQENINVKLKMVNMSVLLAATLSNNGPDVAIGVDQKLPVNWGIRGAIKDLSNYDDFENVKERFSDSAITPLAFDNKVYGLPDTEDFLVMFYRKDILEEIGVTNPPLTWDEVIDISPKLQKQYFDFYIPLIQGALSPTLYAMIEQNDGKLYLNNGAESGLLEPGSLKAFMDFSSFFTNYGFVLEANFLNRFRSGEMPIGIANFTMYNSLAVFAPDILGQWDYGFLPGTYDNDNNLKQDTASNVTSTIILDNTKEEEASWKFVKWWLSDRTQLDYARGMEAILGSAARYPTANLNAFSQLPWSAKDLLILEQQRNYAKGIPTVPGDYIVGRYIDNAFRQTLNEGIIPQDSLYQYHLKINEELIRKRRELGIK